MGGGGAFNGGGTLIGGQSFWDTKYQGEINAGIQGTGVKIQWDTGYLRISWDTGYVVEKTVF